MKNSTSLLLLIAATAATGVIANVVHAEDTAPAPRSVPPHRAAMQAYHQQVISIYDVDKNGRLDDDERAVLQEHLASGEMTPPPGGPRGARGRGPGPGVPGAGPRGLPPAIVDQYDANNDGRLDDTERATLRADVSAGKVELPPRAPRGGRAARGPAPEILERYDANADGKLDEAERATLHADVEAGRITPPGRGPRGFGRDRGAAPSPAAE